MNPIEETPLVRIVDDDASICASLSFMLRHEGYEVSCWQDGESFLRDDQPSRPGCVLLDIRMPKISGLELQQILRERSIRTPIVFISAHGDIETAVHTMKFGAFDFLPKPLDPERVSRIIEEAIRVDILRKAGTPDAEEAKRRFKRLTERERQIAELLLSGVENAEISARLNISQRTVENHRANLYHKLEVRNADELLRLGESACGSEGRRRRFQR